MNYLLTKLINCQTIDEVDRLARTTFDLPDIYKQRFESLVKNRRKYIERKTVKS
jgi:hypothetical protein